MDYANSLKLYQQLGNRRGEARPLRASPCSPNFRASTPRRSATPSRPPACAGASATRQARPKCSTRRLVPRAARGLPAGTRALPAGARPQREIGNRAPREYLDSLGYAEYHAGDFAEAAACYERALSIFRAVGDRWGEADTLTNLGDIRHAAGELPQAREAWQQALAILDDLQHPDAAKVRAKLATAGRNRPVS